MSFNIFIGWLTHTVSAPVNRAYHILFTDINQIRLLWRVTLINVMSKCFLKERLCGVISRYFWTLSFIPSDNDFAKDRQYTLIYDGNASTDYETIGARLIMQNFLNFFSPYWMHIVICVHKEILFSFYSRECALSAVSRLNRSNFLVKWWIDAILNTFALGQFLPPAMAVEAVG